MDLDNSASLTTALNLPISLDKFSAPFDLKLHSQFTEPVPLVLIQFAGQLVTAQEIGNSTRINFTTPELPADDYWLTVKLINKDDTELCRFGRDMIIGIESVRVQHYDHEFSIYSEYEPVYPEPWYSEQKTAGTIPSPIIHSNYIGWPGEWRLQISLPVYRWIHNMTSQGWLI